MGEGAQAPSFWLSCSWGAREGIGLGLSSLGGCGLSWLRCQPLLVEFLQKALQLKPRLQHLYTPPSMIRSNTEWWSRVIYKLTPLTWASASPGGCLLAQGEQPLVGWHRNRTPAGPRTVPSPPSPAILRWISRSSSDVREIRHKIPGAENSSHTDIPPPSSLLISSEAEILTPQGNFSKLSNFRLHT